MMDRDELAALDAAVLTLRHSVVKFGGVSQPTIRDKIADGIRALIDENARLREALELLRDLPIIENDGPDTLHIKGHAHTGPVVDYFFHAIRKIKEVARTALSPNPDQQED